MEEKSKGISLRKKRSVRPKISAPKQISGPLPAGLNVQSIQEAQARSKSNDSSKLDLPRSRPAPPGGKTSDLVKRRYSTRFANPQDLDGEAPPIPSLPSMPKQFLNDKPPSRDGRPSTGGEGQRIKVDVKAMRDPNLRPEQYVAQILADATEDDVYQYQEALRKLKNRTSTDLQLNVFQNRTQFIKISKEADKLKDEMRTLRGLIAELSSAIDSQSFSSANKVDTTTVRKQANRSSVANLEALWNTHLQELWRRVEGSQKFLPAVPGRHVIYESKKWVQLDAATWKAQRRIIPVLLNDHLLIATEKKRAELPSQNPRDVKQRQNQGSSHLVAQRCWPLQDVRLADLSTRSGIGGRDDDKHNVSDAINIRVGTESFTYCATGSSSGTDKAAFLSAFHKAVDDLRKTTEVERGGQKEFTSSSSIYNKDFSALRKSTSLSDISDNPSATKNSTFIDVDGKQQSIRGVESQMDELDIDIALQQFEDAVVKVEKLKRLAKHIRNNILAQEIVTHKVNERAAKLAGLIARRLQNTHNWATSTKRHVEWLVRLGFEDRAREVYLSARTETVQKRSRQCVFEGDLHAYIFEISFIYFTIIKNTVDVYSKCFPPVMTSASVKWAKEQVDEFNAILSRQLSSVRSGSDTWRDCMERAIAHASMLSDVGLDFKGLIGKGIDVQKQEGQGVGLGLS
ncbi:hypothetical protein M501DRAFT_935411 [Patellaria atrata CBS 101060]|uniref:Exocyst complex component EXO84 n=1 Tax=Patellaria atrata CBS 101060 TaxID=1346257 RepID=A0A9P4SA90_9PEZI|nr:hypothetical protein M501DRAFT_935411 [Patellaria atrata CBS 101060]